VTPRSGTPAQFAALRQFLIESNYTEEAICDRLDIPSLSKIVHLRQGGPRADALEWLIRAFLLEETMPAEWLPAESVELLRTLGLVEGEAAVTGTVKLYPVQGIYVVSDRDLSGGNREEHVFSAISPQTEDFLRMMPRTKCPSLLEVCSGAGAAAMLSARDCAVQAFAFDVSERCRLFAEFSRRLNGLANVTARRGDMYALAGRQTFDRILAHPPYVPSLRNTQLFRDGGADGEFLTRRVVEGLPAHLHPGGRLYLIAMLAEYGGDSIPGRIRRWLREAGREFDVLVVLRGAQDAGGFLFENCAPEDLAGWRQLLEQRRIRRFRQVHVIVERHRLEASAITLVREAGEGYAVGDGERALATAQRLQDDEWLRSRRPRLAVGISCASHAELRDGSWTAARRVIECAAPFRVSGEFAAEAVELLSRCDGSRTVEELGNVECIRELLAAGLLEAE